MNTSHNISTQVNTEVSEDIIAKLVLTGDLGALNEIERFKFYKGLCDHVGLDYRTTPFQLIKLQGKVVVYCTRAGAAQLNKLHHVSHTILSRQMVGDQFTVIAKAWLPDGRQTESMGAVCVNGKRNEDLSNAMMKSETKAKRRATLDLLGLGVTDEEELEGMSGLERVANIELPPEPPSASPKPASTPPVQQAPPPATAAAPEPAAAPAQEPAPAAEPGRFAPSPKEKDIITLREKLESKGIPEKFIVDSYVKAQMVPKESTKLEDFEHAVIETLLAERAWTRVMAAWAKQHHVPPNANPPASAFASKEPTVTKDPSIDQEPFQRKLAEGSPYATLRDLKFDYREIAVHFGMDKNLKIKDMDRKKFGWYYKNWKPAPYKGRISARDFDLDAALYYAGREDQ